MQVTVRSGDWKRAAFRRHGVIGWARRRGVTVGDSAAVMTDPHGQARHTMNIPNSAAALGRTS
ncbi:MAG: hypothetical protein ABIP94_01880, partial [Planctomycetota bacterium]